MFGEITLVTLLELLNVWFPNPELTLFLNSPDSVVSNEIIMLADWPGSKVLFKIQILELSL